MTLDVDPLGQPDRLGDALGPQRTRCRAGSDTASRSPAGSQAEGRFHGGRDEHPSSHRQRFVGRRSSGHQPTLETSEEGFEDRGCRPVGQGGLSYPQPECQAHGSKAAPDRPTQRREGQKKELKEAYRKLIAITQASCTQAERVVKALQGYADDPGARRLLESLEHFVPLVERGITQATRRVLHDESRFRQPRRS
jgi:hypothetical protein